MKTKMPPGPKSPGTTRAPQRAGISRVAEWRMGRVISIIASGNYPNCQTLAREIEGVSAKTIQRDIDHLRIMKGLPLEYDAARRGYYFTRPVSEFAPMQLSRGELVALFVAQKALEPLRGTRLQRLVAESVNKIAAACPEAVTLHWEDLDAAFSVKATGVLAADATLFATLLEAVLNRRELAFDYQKLESRRQERRRVQPYHVGQHQNGWYLVAHDLQRGDMRKFALQRMTKLEVLRTKFQWDASFNMREYLSSGFGAWSYAAGSQSHTVRIRFTGWAARVVAERQWHATQRIVKLAGEDETGAVEFHAAVAGLEEMTRWVLSHGRHAEVLGPPELVRQVQEELAAMTAAFQTRRPPLGGDFGA